jgi:nicotinamidase-related amidase
MHSAQQSRKPFTSDDSAIVLVDHQPGVLAMVGSLPADAVTRNVGVLARLGEELDLPLIVTSTRETVEFLGTNLPSIQAAAPKAYAARVRRAGTLNAFADDAFVRAVKNTGRSNLVIAGLLTDVCLLHSVISALGAGYAVQVVADASGTSTALADLVTLDRLRDQGAVITTTYGILFELFPDLSTAEGQRAEAVAASGAKGA